MDTINEIINRLETLYAEIDSLNFDVSNLDCEDLACDVRSKTESHLDCCIDDLANAMDFMREISHTCPNCGYYLTYDDSVYCVDCNSNNNEVCSYHDYNIVNNTNSNMTFGVELETSEITSPVEMPYGWICTEDSSISGLEYVSRVYSFSETQIFNRDIISLCDELSYVGADTHKDIDTGLHIHINMSAFKCSSKNLWRFVLKHKYEFMSIGGRLPHKESFSYCKPKNNLNDSGSSVFDRYALLNINQKYNTIEFRFFNGTLNPETIRLRVQFLKQLVYFSDEINSETTFNDFLDYIYLCDSELYRFVTYWLDKRQYKIRELFNK
ncbi:MAG: amidoligase family protein [archaeon]|nr:amidoligase family protein [archaeon]